MDLDANFYDFDSLGYNYIQYTSQFEPESKAGFANNSRAKAATKDMVLTFTLLKNRTPEVNFNFRGISMTKVR